MESQPAYVVKKSARSRSLRVTVYPDGRCVVSAPSFLGAGAIERFVARKSAWISDKLRAFMPFRPTVRRKHPRTMRAEYLKHRETARTLVENRIPELNAAYGFRIGRIAIKNQKSRWGSCSSKGNLNFNYRIALLSPRLADYIIVHELCHLGELNHSKAFWDLVARTMPDWRERRSELLKIDTRCI